jgi:hypothetical protein
MMKFDPRLPTTPGIRAPRYGESILSINGSPLQVPLAAIAGTNGGAFMCIYGCLIMPYHHPIPCLALHTIHTVYTHLYTHRGGGPRLPRDGRAGGAGQGEGVADAGAGDPHLRWGG